MKNIKKLLVLVLIIVLSISFTGCYHWSEVSSNQIGLQMDDGVTISKVVNSGRYTDWGWFANIEKIDTSAKTVIWEDPDMWTSDKQPVKFKISVTYSRSRDEKAAKILWEKYNSEATDDKTLQQLVTTRIPRVAKQVTTSMTLDQMLGITSENSAANTNEEKGRELLQDNMSKLLKEELSECGIDLLDVGVNDIGVDEDYAKQLKEKAVSKVASEVSKEKTAQLNEQLNQEKAQTLIDQEVANRKNNVLGKENEIYLTNPRAYELERLRLLKDVIGDSDKIYFVPSDADLNLVLSGSGNVSVPIDNKEK
jgi:hypothetical protein